MKTKIYSVYDRPTSEKIGFTEPTLTQAQFAREADINFIMEKYRETGFLVDPFISATREPLYGDFTNAKSYQEVQNIIVNAQERFNSLPAKIRERFNNDSMAFLDFLSDEKNLPEAEYLGLVEARDSSSLDVTVPTDTEPKKQTTKEV